ncbi:MAG: NME NM23 member 5, partial [Paramarteilia canceri]
RKRIHLNKEQSEELYEEHYGKGFYDELSDYIASGPMDALLIGSSDPDLVQKLREFVGPADIMKAKVEYEQSLRALYGQDNIKNGVHSSLSKTLADKEVKFFFPERLKNTLLKQWNDCYEYMEEIVIPIILESIKETFKKQPQDHKKFFLRYLEENNPFSPITIHPEHSLDLGK